MKDEREALSVANDIKALALINIRDIFQFMITATDDEIEQRYSTEKDAISVAEKYLDIGLRAQVLEYPIAGWSMKYTMPVKDSDERNEYTAYFYDKKNKAQEPEPEPKPAPKKQPKPKKTTTKKQLDVGKIKALRDAGWSFQKIADEMGVASAQTIANHLKNAD